MTDKEIILEVSLLAGKIMLESGAETSRVEDTMERIIRHALHVEQDTTTYTYVTVNGIFVQLDHSKGTNFVRIDSRGHNLERITAVNQISRSFAGGDMTLREVYESLLTISGEDSSYPLWLRIICATVLSGSVVLIFGGRFVDLPAGMAAGLLCYLIHLVAWRVIKASFFAEYVAAFIGGTLAYCLTTVSSGNLDSVMMGAVAPLVPGIAITTAIRDIMAKHYLSGLIRGLEAIFIAGALGTGIATVYYIFIL
ncbi:threonine/serine exporter family protein [Alicyclobacillus fastidiosus]|uniref:Threonine/serine exporter family protein n=1 Tax=Alicyclobacillus fastidiosus TaxID=392011 RepID=A0ABV5AJW7_9BACL|nr:threonine/serine exporter family protein [Alicyclobacillus fastidiosus]WEH10159.1 threonine/serine exporter family protein [Alicyclobacillus fastidiosus]